jgi:hypothetical protein
MRTCPALRPRRDQPDQANAVQPMLPSAVTTASAPATIKFFRGSMTRPIHSLSTLRRRDYSWTTQDSLPAVGQRCRAGFTTRWVPLQGLASHNAPPCPGFTWRTVTIFSGEPSSCHPERRGERSEPRSRRTSRDRKREFLRLRSKTRYAQDDNGETCQKKMSLCAR